MIDQVSRRSARRELGDGEGSAPIDRLEWAGDRVAKIRKGFDAMVVRSGLAGVTPHVLRHTAGVHMAAGGVPLSQIAQFMGHTSTAVTEKVYARFAPDHLRDAAEILDFGKMRSVK